MTDTQYSQPHSFTLGSDDVTFRGSTGSYTKRLSDMAGVYGEPDAFEQLVAERGEQVAYVVEEFRRSEDGGDLIFGLSSLNPGRIGREFAVTRGHRHVLSDRTEIYYGISGSGVLLMEDPNGKIEALDLVAGSVAYVPPHWIHRSVNTGDMPLVSLFCYPADSGQDYAVIERHGGMAKLVVIDGEGGWMLEQNPRYRRTT